MNSDITLNMHFSLYMYRMVQQSKITCNNIYLCIYLFIYLCINALFI